MVVDLHPAVAIVAMVLTCWWALTLITRDDE